jgi:transcriptional regulator GlxA family with amidase domain
MFMPSQSDGFPNRLFLNEEELGVVTNICEIMLKEYEEKKAGFELVLRALLISLIGIILRSYTNQSGKDFENYDKIIPALKYIEEHYSEKITLEMLADQCFLSGRQLSRIFSKIYGMSPIDYLVNYRLTTAYLHILSSDDSVASIAEKCGFYDESHMSRLFLKRFNFSPKSIDKNYDYFRTPKEDLEK